LLNPAKPLNVAMAMKNAIPKTAKQEIRKNYDPRTVLVRCLIMDMTESGRTHNDNGVPSSAN
jgi:hypothetical protein